MKQCLSAPPIELPMMMMMTMTEQKTLLVNPFELQNPYPESPIGGDGCVENPVAFTIRYYMSLNRSIASFSFISRSRVLLNLSRKSPPLTLEEARTQQRQELQWLNEGEEAVLGLPFSRRLR